MHAAQTEHAGSFIIGIMITHTSHSYPAAPFRKYLSFKLLILFLLFLAVDPTAAHSQVAINTTGAQPNTSAMLDISSTARGILIPRMTKAQRDAISVPAEGLMIYQTNDESGYYYFSTTAFPIGWKKVADGSETKLYAGNNMRVTGSGTTASPYQVHAGSHYIGELYGGGVVFYVYDGGQHGLIAALADQSPSSTWDNGNPVAKITGVMYDGLNYANGGGLNGGNMNTALVVAGLIGDNVTGNFAARYCADYYCVDNSDVYLYYGDWYLPSIFELQLMYQQKAVLGIADGIYWSSNEATDPYQAWVTDFSGYGYYYTMLKYQSAKVRAIRAF